MDWRERCGNKLVSAREAMKAVRDGDSVQVNWLHAVVTTKLWKYKDDVVIQIQPAQPSGSWLWVRSSSRVGKGDLGANTRHIMDLVRYVDETVPKQALVAQ